MSTAERTVGWRSRDIVRTAALVIGMYLLLQLLWFANKLVLVAFLGVLFGLAVEAGVDQLQRIRIRRFRIPRGVAAASIVLTFFALLVGIGAVIAPTVREQSAALKVRIPEAVDRFEKWLSQRRTGLFGFVFGPPASQAPSAPVPGVARTESTAVTAMDSARARRDTTRVSPDTTTPVARPSETLGASIGRQIGGASKYVFSFLSQTVAVFAGIVLIIFMSIYIGAEPSVYHAGLMGMFPIRLRIRAGEVLSAMAAVLRRWLVTQLIAMVVIGVVTTIALLILDVEAAFALGLIAGLLEFIPTIGPTLSAIPAVAMGFLDSPEKALTVALVYIGIQFMENHLLIPLLMKEGVKIPPVITILGQALFTLLFGFLGLMVAVPALAAGMVAVRMLYMERVARPSITIEAVKSG